MSTCVTALHATKEYKGYGIWWDESFYANHEENTRKIDIDDDDVNDDNNSSNQLLSGLLGDRQNFR